ncbi:MAG: AAA family ATPase [Phycisphaeraceae bacterium]
MEGFRAISGAVAAGAIRPHEQARRAPLPFITISRQAGAGGIALKDKLVQRLRAIDKADPPWTGFDRELVEKVAADYDLSSPLLETLDEASHSYLNELFSALLISKPEPNELAVYRRVAKTIRALAQVGRVVIVGRGGMFITEDMPAGVHVHLVAPLAQRIEMAQRTRGFARKEAAEWVQRIDENRAAFYRRHWPQRTVGPEVFSVVFNTAHVSEDAMVEALLPLIPGMQEKRDRHRQHAAQR